MTQSNTLRARTGERPTCFDRPDYPDLVTVRDGWTWDGRQKLATVPNPMSNGCASWSVAAHENPAADSVPAQESWRCYGCRHLPQDTRVIARAHQSEILK